MRKSIRQAVISFLTVAALAACSGSGGGGGGSSSMSLSVGDAPVDGAKAVVVTFTGVQLIPDSGSEVDITFTAPKSIDLLNQSGTASAVLFDQPVPAGSYSQIRLLVEADGNPSNSYITLSDDTTEGLNVPSGAQTGLKLVSGFTVPAGGVADYAIDFDLRKAITCPPGHGGVCTLKPALRLVDNTTVGNIQGVVDSSLIVSGCMPGVYLYSGNVTQPEDNNSTAPVTDTNQPLSSRAPVLNVQSQYYYQFAFLPPGTYTIAFTCEADQDNPDQPDPSVLFGPITTDVTVAAGQTSTVNLP